jgi:hypothetical protein
MVRVGTAALDGTKLAGNAGNKANRTHEKIEAEVAEIFRQAAEADQRQERLLGAVFGRWGSRDPAALEPALRWARQSSTRGRDVVAGSPAQRILSAFESG